jgi:hypothetical protein
MNKSFKLLILGFSFCTALSWSKTFRTEFVRFELPPNWDCKKEELDWVCQSDNLNEHSEVLLIVVAKDKNDADDSLEKYSEYLKVPRQMRDLAGNAYQSKVHYVNKKTIKEQPWIDSLHAGSEIPGFYSRYLATTKDKVAALVTYSIADSVNAKWAPIMDSLINSMEVYFDPKAYEQLLATKPQSLLPRGGFRNKHLKPEEAGDVLSDEKSGATDWATLIGGLIFVAAIVGYIIYKKKQKKTSV